MLRELATRPADHRLAQIDAIPAADLEATTRRWNTNPMDVPATTVPALFADAAQRYHAETALFAGGDEWTFGELAQRVNRLARLLIAHGVGPEVPVALISYLIKTAEGGEIQAPGLKR